MSKNKFKLSSILDSPQIPFYIIGVGIVFRFIEYISNKSFWYDEARTAWKVIHHPPLSFVAGTIAIKEQPYPPGFLVIEKFFVELLGNSEYVLRLYPFLCGIIALFLFYRIAQLFLPERSAVLAAAFFAFSANHIYFSSELKPYSSDVLFAVLLLGMFCQFHSSKVDRLNIFPFGLVGAVAIWFSYPAIFILTGAGFGLGLYYLAEKNWKKIKWLFNLVIVWAASFAMYYLVFIRHFVADPELVEFWNITYMPTNVFSAKFYMWLIGSFSVLFKKLLNFPASLAGFLCLVSCCTMFYKERAKFCILVPPILVTLLASGLHKYPFQGRVLTFLIPTFILIVVYGILVISERQSKEQGRLIKFIIVGLLIFYPTIYSVRQAREPHGQAEIKPVMQYIAENKQPGDLIYLYYASYDAFLYYSQEYGLSNNKYILGISSKKKWKRYKADLLRCKGHPRVWIVFSDVYYKEPDSEREYMLKYLKKIGTQLDSFQLRTKPYLPPRFLNEYFSAGVYLYDLSAIKE